MMIYMQNRTVAGTFREETAQERAAKLPIAHLEIFRAGNLETDFSAIPIRSNMKIMHRQSRIN